MPADERRDVRLRATDETKEPQRADPQARSRAQKQDADDVLQLTLKFFRTENVVIAHAIMDEARDAIDALLNEQLTK